MGSTRHLGMPVLVTLTLVATIALVGAGCAEPSEEVMGAQPSRPPEIHPLPVETTVDPAGSDSADGSGAAYVRNGSGVALPDPSATPGASFPDVDTVEICQLHYVQGVRQPRFNTKVAAFAQYGISIRDRDVYRVDHLIPVSLGGTNDETNLWPQPGDEQGGSTEKDLLERQLRGLVCSLSITLAEAQVAIAADWWTAYQTYMGRPVLPGTLGPEPWQPTAEPQPGEVVNGGPCPIEGAVGFTQPKNISLTCLRGPTGALSWQKRY